MVYRSSKYIDFNTCRVVMPPMVLSRQLARPLDIGQMLELFECRVDVWQFGPAVAILQLMEKPGIEQSSIWTHSAYVLLGSVFPYFEMIGKILNPRSRERGTASIDFNYGFCDVYPNFAPPSGTTPENSAVPDVVEFRDRVRNGIYHLGYTKGNLFIWNEAGRPDFEIDRSRRDPVYYLNPHNLTRTLVDHFPGLMQRLRDPGAGALQQQFERFFVEFHGLRQ